MCLHAHPMNLARESSATKKNQGTGGTKVRIQGGLKTLLVLKIFLQCQVAGNSEANFFSPDSNSAAHNQ